jgi:type I restriction enzyme R subunit
VHFTESIVEDAALAWFESLGFGIESGPEIAFDRTRPERKAVASYTDVVLEAK